MRLSIKKLASIPDEVIEAINELIVANWNGHSATFTQTNVVGLIQRKLHCSEDQIYKNHWIDFEDIYRNKGWSVTYDKPGFNESYEPTFKFTIKK